jgi:hypothetical protein
MRTSAIVEVKIAADRLPRLADTVVGTKIHLLVFDTAPQPLDKSIVSSSAFTVHADRDVVAMEYAREGCTCKLRALDALLFVKRRFWSR